MKQSRYGMFELLVIIFGAGTVITVVLASPFKSPTEIIAQLLLIPVLLAALHYGQRGGIVSFLLASAIYFLMMVSEMINTGLIIPILQLLFLRVVLYGVVGIGGGIICSRIKYLFARLERHGFSDNITGLYSSHFIAQLISKYAEEFRRYQTGFSVVTLQIDRANFKDIKEPQISHELRKIGSKIRDDIRAIDEVGCAGDNTFALILPNTNTSGATILVERLRKLIAHYIKKHNATIEDNPDIEVEAFEYPQDKEGIDKLQEKLLAQPSEIRRKLA